MIPLFRVEENYQAVFAWWWAHQRGGLTEAPALVNLDAHLAAALPRLSVSLEDALQGHFDKDPERSVQRWVEEELHLPSFLIPAICAKLIQNAYTIRPSWHRDYRPRLWSQYRQIAGSLDGKGREFIGGTINKRLVTQLGNLGLLDPAEPSPRNAREVARLFKRRAADAVLYRHTYTTLGYLPRNIDFALSINLNFFSCLNEINVREPIDIELTPDGYALLTDTKYHSLRHLGFALAPTQTPSRSFLRLTPFRYHQRAHVNSPEVIVQQVAILGQALRELDRGPKVITIARSVNSGYTPRDQADFIIDQLMNQLHSLYGSELCPQAAF